MKRTWILGLLVCGSTVLICLAAGTMAADGEQEDDRLRTTTLHWSLAESEPSLEDQLAELQASLVQAEYRIASLESQMDSQADFLGRLQDHISIDGNGKLEIEAVDLSLIAWNDLQLSGTQVDVSSMKVRIDAATTEFAGTVQSDVLITDSVVASSYTPGAGNIW